MANWAALPTDILVRIADSVEFLLDYFNFLAVCKSFHEVQSILQKTSDFPSKYPYVMLTDIAEKNYPEITGRLHPGDMLLYEFQRYENIEGMKKRRFYSLESLETCEIDLPEATRRKCIGVGFRWLLTVGFDLEINLLHPFTRRQIGMPPFMKFKKHPKYGESFHPGRIVRMFLEKAVISSDPDDKKSNQDCVVLAIYGEKKRLAFARLGDEEWTDFYGLAYDDVAYYKGSFYVIDCNAKVYVVDMDDENGPSISAAARVPTENMDGPDKSYLVESLGSLLVVLRRRHHYVRREQPTLTTDFSIYRMEECQDAEEGTSEYPYKLTEVESLDQQSLFLGSNASVSLPSSKCIKANSIYFSEDNCERYVFAPFGGGNDTGTFDVGSRTVTPHYAAEFKSHITPPLWFI